MDSEETEQSSVTGKKFVAIGPAVWVPSRNASAAIADEAGVSKPPQDGVHASEASSESSRHQPQNDLKSNAAAVEYSVNYQSGDTTRALYESIMSKDDDIVSQILQSDPELAALFSPLGEKPLHVAVDQERTIVVGLLLHYGANAEATDEHGRTALHLAAKNGSLEIARMLLDAGASLEAVSVEGEKPLWTAVCANKESVANLFLDKEADPESLNTKTNTTALTEAVKLKNIRLVKMLLAHGADADANVRPIISTVGEVGNGVPSDSERNEDDTGSQDIGPALSSRLFHAPFDPRPVLKSQVRNKPEKQNPEKTQRDLVLHSVTPEGRVLEIIRDVSEVEAVEEAPATDGLPGDDLYLGPEPELSPVSLLAIPEKDNLVHRSSFPKVEYKKQAAEESGGRRLKEEGRLAGATFSLENAKERLASKSLPPENPAPEKPGDEGRGLLYYHDAIGRRFHFPFELVQTWQGIKKFINLSWAHINPEYSRERVLQGCYDLEDSQGVIIMPSLWTLIIRPGCHVYQKLWPESDRPGPRPQLSSARRWTATPESEMSSARVPDLVTDNEHTQQPQRPLHEALQSGDEEMVRLLLRHGANARLRGPDGRSAQQLAEESGKKELADVIKEGVPLAGPDISRPNIPMQENSEQRPLLSKSRPRAPAPHSMKWEACKSFEALAIQFLDAGAEDERRQKSISIYELLYGQGPQAVFQSQHQRKTSPRFTWYHLPANNMEWVEHLILNILIDQQSQHEQESSFASSQFDQSVPRARLHNELEALRRKASSITKSWRLTRNSFIKPLCTEVHDEEVMVPNIAQNFSNKPEDTSQARGSRSIMAFIPFLHFETFQGQTMATKCVERLRGVRTGLRKHSVSSTHPIEQLISGYMIQTLASDGIAGSLQPRRSLDDYFFAHLQNSGSKDASQVLWRFSKNKNPRKDPKIFMVDQLWMWILDDSTIITCSPLNWDAWASELSNEGQIKHIWQGEDPVNIQRKVTDHLKKITTRSRISSVYEMAQLIADKCAPLFEGHNLDDDLHFFDFFEQTIARVSDDATKQLQLFRKGLDHTNHQIAFDIQREMNLLIEVQDIKDELGIVETVLNEQRVTLSTMREIFLRTNVCTQWEENKVLLSHFVWVERMNKTNDATRDALYRLLELKQKQHAAKQAELAAEQSHLAVQNSAITNEQLNLMRAQTEETAKQLTVSTQLLGMMQRQSEESDKQSKTLLVFTVVTIIFLPSSFLATVFAINMDVFPLNSEGQLPLGYFLKYLFSISVAVCAPLLIVAFNLPRISQWLTEVTNTLLEKWKHDRSTLVLNIIVRLSILGLVSAIIVPIWTSKLSLMIKSAATACVAVFLFIGVVVYLINALVRAARETDSSAKSDLSRSSLMDDSSMSV